MPSKRFLGRRAGERKAFSSFVIAAFLLQMFAPFASAYSASPASASDGSSSGAKPASGALSAALVQRLGAEAATPTPAPLSACTSSSMTASQVKAFWDATQDFTGDEVNSLSNSALLKSNSTAFSQQTGNGQVIVNNYISTGSADSAKRVPVADVARILGKSSEEVATDFAVDPVNGTISMQMFQAEADKNPALSKFMGQFSSLVSNSPAASLEKAAYVNYKIRLPNGKTLALSDLLSMDDLGQENGSCMLDNSFLQGRVSYMGQLDRDLVIGFDRSSTTLKSNQHLTSSNTIAALSLNGGSSVVVPLRYENFLRAIKKVLEVDTIANLVEVGLIFTAKKKTNLLKDDRKEIEESLSVLQGGRDPLAWQDLVNNPHKAELFSYLTSKNVPVSTIVTDFNKMNSEIAFYDSVVAGIAVNPGISVVEARNAITSLKAQQAQLESVLDSVPGVTVPVSLPGTAPRTGVAALGAGVDPATDVKAAIESSTTITTAYGFSTIQSQEVGRELERIKLTEQRNTKLAEGLGLPSETSRLDRIYGYLEGKLMNNFVMGFGWLGAGRFGLSLANGFAVSSNDKRLADNYLKVMINRNDVLASFRDSTNWFLSGRVLEVVSSVTKSGAPREIFGVGPMIFINSPIADSSAYDQASSSSTGLTYSGGAWQVSSDWRGKSDATLFEDVRDDPTYARMPLYVANMTTGLDLKQEKDYADFYALLGVMAPIITWKLYKSAPAEAFVPLSRILIFDMYVGNFVDPNSFSKTAVCDDSVVRTYINHYLLATAISQAGNIANTVAYGGIAQPTWLKTFLEGSKAGSGTALGKLWGNLITATSFVSPSELYKLWAANTGFQYVTTCKDTAYTVVGYQPLEKKATNGLAALRQRLSALQTSSIIGNLSFGSAATGVGNSLSLESMDEIINLRSTMQEQQGMLRPKQMYYLHLDGAQEVSWGIYNAMQSGGCFRKCYDSADSAICVDSSGVTKIDKKTGKVTSLADSDRALLSTLMQDIGRTIIPNTLVSAPLTCGSTDTMLQARSDSHLYALQGCTTTDCIVSQLRTLTGKAVAGGDLSVPLGNVLAVKTTQGYAFMGDGQPIRFTYTAGTQTVTKTVSPLGPGFYEVDGIPVSENDTAIASQDITTGVLTQTVSKVGTQSQSPSLDALASVDAGNMTSQAAYQSANLNVKGDGAVTLSGFVDGTNFDEQDVGQLESIILKNGRIEYDASQNRLVVALYVLGEGDFTKSIDSIVATATKNTDGNTSNNAIRTTVTSKSGMEDAASGINDALKQVQGNGGMQMFETEDYTYYFTKNAAGNDILRVCDHKTSTCKEYKITGSITSDGSTVTVPTENGAFKFNFGTNDKTGAPQITVNGPDGFQEIATLLAARGDNGIFVFDPYTGLAKILNGQDIPLNRDFASSGMSFLSSPDGTKGIASNDYLGYPRGYTASTSAASNPLALPSVPDDNWGIAVLMLCGVLCGVLVVRQRGRKLFAA